jgi:hypothetical protein
MNCGSNYQQENNLEQVHNKANSMAKNGLKKFETPCVNKIILNEQGISYNQLNTVQGNEWVLSKRMEFNKSNLNAITYYFSAKSEGNCIEPINYCTIDSLHVEIQPTQIQKITIPKFESSTNLNNLFIPDSKLLDLNFDGIMDFDLALNDVSGTTNLLRRYFMFNPIKEEFEEGIDLANVRLDTSKQLIYNSWNGGHAGKISNRQWSKIVNYNEQQIVKEIKSEFNSELNSYVVTTSQLASDQKYIYKIDTIERR